MQVPAGLISQYEDLVDDYEEAIEAGLLNEHGLIDDGEPDSAAEAAGVDGSGMDEDYGGPSSSPEPEDQDMIADSEASNSESGDDSDIQFIPSKGVKRKQNAEGTRRSGREGTRKDYTLTLGEEEASSSVAASDVSESDNGSDAHMVGTSGSALRRASPNEDSDDGPVVTTTRIAPRRKKAAIADSDVDELESDTSGDLPLEQMHTDVSLLSPSRSQLLIVPFQACCRCKASPASILLPLYQRKKGKKRRNETEDWNEDSILDLGA